MCLLWLRQLPHCGDWTPASVPPRAEGRSSPTNTPVFPSSSFVLQSFVWFHIFFSAGQVLLSALSWCSVCTSVSEGVFLMYPRRKMYSMSTYSSAILFLYRVTFFKNISSCNYYAQNPKCNSPFLSEWSPVKIYMTQTPWPHWLSGLLFNASLPTSRNSTHINWLAKCYMNTPTSLTSIFCSREMQGALSLCFKALSCTNEKLCGMKCSWLLCPTAVQKWKRLCRNISYRHLPISNS